MSDSHHDLDAALSNIDVKIFAEDPTLTETETFLINMVSQWNPVERRISLATLIKSYGIRSLGTQVVDALVRVICRDIAQDIQSIAQMSNDRYDDQHRPSLRGRRRRRPPSPGSKPFPGYL